MWVSDLKITANLTEREEEKQEITGLRIQGRKCRMLEAFKNQCGKINKVQVLRKNSRSEKPLNK